MNILYQMEKYNRRMNLISAFTLRMMELAILLEVVIYAAFGDKEDISLAISFYITLISNTLVRLLSGYYFSARKKTRMMNWNYYSMFVTIIFFALVYFFLYLFQGNPDSVFWTNLFLALAYIVGALVLHCFNLYILPYYGFSEKAEKLTRILMGAACIVFSLFCASNTYTHLLFRVLADGSVVYSPTFYIGDIYLLLCFIVNIVFILSSKNDRRTKLALMSLMYFPMVVIIVDYLSGVNEKIIVASIFVLGPLISLYTIFFHIYVRNSLDLAEREKELTEKQAQLMVSQIQPHFLFNTLSAIYQLCDTDPKLAKKTISHFSTYLRQNINTISQNEAIPFEQELKHVETYLEIEMLRFSDMLNVEYDIQYKDFHIPALSLQVLVENAVKYGIRSNEDGGTVSIRTFCQNGSVYIVVHDDGQGFDPDAVMNDGKTHFGIKNARIRIENMCHGKLLIDSKPGGGGTTAAIIIEAEVVEDEDVIA